jgi:carbamoyl-phosphate synthase large subunit
VLLNSNPATIMTDPEVADHVYIEPMTLEVVERILEKEQPDSVLPNLGGQTGLNLSMELARSGYLDKHGIRLLACKPDTIDRAEDRQLFKETMEKLHQPIIPSDEVVEDLPGPPSPVRTASATPSSCARPLRWAARAAASAKRAKSCIEIGTNGLRLSPIHQILVEKCIAAGKRSNMRSCATTRATSSPSATWKTSTPSASTPAIPSSWRPSQTLSDHEYQMLRTAALDIITELGIEGGCNCSSR